MHLHFFTSHLSYFSHLSYPGVFLAILGSGHVIPVPEMVTLITLGYVTSLGKLTFLGVSVVAIAATLTTDLVTYALCLGGSELATQASQKIKAELLNRYSQAEEKHLFGLIFLSHFVPGWRFANPIIAGVTQMPWKKFFLYSFISSIMYAPLFVSLGFFFKTKIGPLALALESLHHFVLWLIILGILTIALVYNMRNAKE